MLCIDPQAHEAYLGLADCALGRGQFDEAIDELVGAAQDFAERGSLQAAFALMTKALLIDPSRLELHIDVAELEASAGRIDMATARLQNLAHAYHAAGQHDEAEAVLEAAAAFTSIDRGEPMHHAVPRVIAETHTEPQPILVEVRPEPLPVIEPEPEAPPARTGDTFVGVAPRAEQSVARTAARRREGTPALSWRPSTIQMKALTADMPTPNVVATPLPGVPRAIENVRTAPIVHAPKRTSARSPEPVARKIVPAARPTASPDATIPISTMLAPTKAPVVKRTVAKAVAPAPKIEEPAKQRLAIKKLPGKVKPRPSAPPAAKVLAVIKPVQKRAPAPVRAAPAPKKVEPKRAAPPKPSAKKDGESLADRLRKHSTGRREHLAAKVRRIADAEKQRPKTNNFDEDATTLWCPDHLRI